MSRVHIDNRVWAIGGLRLATWGAAALLAIGLAGGDGAEAGVGVLAPGLTLGTISLDKQTAVVTGDVDGLVTGSQLTVNGNAVLLDDGGDFTTVVELNGAAALELALAGLRSEKVMIHVPLQVVVAKNGKGVLDDLQQAGITLDVPGDGFTVVDGQLPPVTGSVLRPEHLASLTVNGREALRLVGPSGRFVVTQPPPSGGAAAPGEVAVRAVDRQGVSQTTVFRTTRLTTAIRTRVGTSIAAAGARGIRIAALRLNTRSVLTARRVAVVVTVEDRRGYLVRGAAVRVVGMPQRYIANGPTQVGFTNRYGEVRFAYGLRKTALRGGRPKAFTALARASTPLSRASSWATRRLPLTGPGDE